MTPFRAHTPVTRHIHCAGEIRLLRHSAEPFLNALFLQQGAKYYSRGDGTVAKVGVASSDEEFSSEHSDETEEARAVWFVALMACK